MERSDRLTNGKKGSKKRTLRFPAFPVFLLFLLASCGGGGGGGESPPPPPPPTVHTDNATIVGQNVATLNGTVNPNGFATEAWFEYGTNPNLASFDNTTTKNFAAGSITQPVAQSISGLTPGTTYYFRLVASSVNGWVEGDIFSFTTRNPPPAVTTDNATSITLTGGTLNGTVTPNGAATDAWFEYGEDPTLSVFTPTDNQGLGSGRAPVAVQIQRSGLKSGATYYYRAVAASVEGEVEGAIKSFSTDIPPPAATTGSATGITTAGATVKGTVNPNGFSTEAWFEYGLDNSLATFDVTTPQPMGSGTTDNAISAGVGPLIPYRTYYFRAVASSTTDPEVFTKGAIRSFPTGEYYVAFGDSITLGSRDTIPGDGIGYEPVLDSLLTPQKGYSVEVVNAGASAETSANGRNRIGDVLFANPSANYFLILYGTNDALISNGPVTKATYKANMQTIITRIKSAGKIPYLAKVPYNTDPTFSITRIQEYNAAIVEMINENGITVTPPDFYALFQDASLLDPDGIHPNGAGYQSMANLWFNALP